MPLTIAEVEHIAELARLSLTDEEKPSTRISFRHPGLCRYPARGGYLGDPAHGHGVAAAQRDAGRCRRAVPAHRRRAGECPEAADGYFRVKAILEAAEG